MMGTDVTTLHLPSYADRYTDTTRLLRLKFIAKVCPKLKVPALRLAIDYVKTTFNVKLYDELYSSLCGQEGERDEEVPLPYDSYWVEDNMLEATLLLQELDAELNFKKSNSSSGHVRRILEEIGDYHEKSGNLQLAVKFYARTRAYCTSSDNVITMFRHLIRVSIYMTNWWHVLSYTDEAKQYALGFENLAQEVPPRLSCAAGLANMGLKNYKSAALHFLATPFGNYDYDKIVTPEDVCFCAGLCAMATFEREKLQVDVLSSESFKPFFLISPKMRSTVANFYEGQVEVTLGLLGEIEYIVRLDVYLSPHVDALYKIIKGRLPK
ncbi:hypothetical protein KR200_004122, partial [Drosophila serrata]